MKISRILIDSIFATILLLIFVVIIHICTITVELNCDENSCFYRESCSHQRICILNEYKNKTFLIQDILNIEIKKESGKHTGVKFYPILVLKSGEEISLRDVMHSPNKDEYNYLKANPYLIKNISLKGRR